MRPAYAYDLLLSLPLFQGMGKSEMFEITEKIKLDFRRQPKGHYFARQDEICKSLRYVVSGDVCVRTASTHNDFTLSEWVHAPLVLQPERLFGWSPSYSRSFVAASTIHTLEIDKAAVRDILMLYPTFRLNYMNIACTPIHRAETRQWQPVARTFSGRLVQLVSSRCYYPAGRKELHVDRSTLAESLHANTRSFSTILREMEKVGWLELYRERIVIPKFEVLLQAEPSQLLTIG